MINPIYIFFHIRKTGGTSLRSMLCESNRKIPVIFYYKLDNTFSNLNERTRYIIGHEIYYGIHKYFKTKKSYYIIFLRDPTERFKSYYNNIRVDCILKKKIIPSFEDWFNETKYHSIIEGILHERSSEKNRINLAKSILDKSSFIGLQESFENDLKSLFGENVPILQENMFHSYSLEYNISSYNFKKLDIELISNSTKDDYELYNYALELRKNNHNHGFKIDLDK